MKEILLEYVSTCLCLQILEYISPNCCVALFIPCIGFYFLYITYLLYKANIELILFFIFYFLSK